MCTLIIFYGNPKRLHRLELRLNNQDIRKILDSLGIRITEDIIFDKERLDALYTQAPKQHLFRKTFGRKVIESAGEQSEMALIKLSEIFNHASPMITRRYLGLRSEELEEVYEALSF